MKEEIKKIKEETKVIKKEVKKRVITYITAAFGLVAALAWNDAIKSLIAFLFPLKKNSVVMKFVYAVIITITVTILTIYISKLFSRGEEK